MWDMKLLFLFIVIRIKEYADIYDQGIPSGLIGEAYNVFILILNILNNLFVLVCILCF
jgi:hypothetical protein